MENSRTSDETALMLEGFTHYKLGSGIVVIQSTNPKFITPAQSGALSSMVGELGPNSEGVIIDLNGINLMSSTGLGGIVSAYHQAIGADFDMVLAQPSKVVDSILTNRQLKNIIPVYGSLDEAVVYLTQ